MTKAVCRDMSPYEEYFEVMTVWNPNPNSGEYDTFLSVSVWVLQFAGKLR